MTDNDKLTELKLALIVLHPDLLLAYLDIACSLSSDKKRCKLKRSKRVKRVQIIKRVKKSKRGLYEWRKRSVWK